MKEPVHVAVWVTSVSLAVKVSALIVQTKHVHLGKAPISIFYACKCSLLC